MTDLFGFKKDEQALEMLRMFCPLEGYYLAFSGGKDSCVAKDLLIRSGVKFDAHYCMTQLDPPELVWFIKKHHPEVTRHLPEVSPWKLIPQKGLPTRQAAWCCDKLKENTKSSSGRFVVTGVRADESNGRSRYKQFETRVTKFVTKKILHIILSWTEDDVWSYIRSRGLPYCSLYDEGFKRIGCVMCPKSTAKNRIREAKRFPRIAKALYDACGRLVPEMTKRMAAKGKTPKYPNQNALWNWWLQGAADSEGKVCLGIFD